jgi:hypothetical protein
MRLEELSRERRIAFADAIEAGNLDLAQDAYAALSEVLPDSYAFRSVLDAHLAEAESRSDRVCHFCGEALEIDDHGEVDPVCPECWAAN